MRLDMSSESLNMSRSESVTELNSELLSTPSSIRSRSSFSKDPDISPSKSFGLGKCRTDVFIFRRGIISLEDYRLVGRLVCLD